jgi:hypothetical protein
MYTHPDNAANLARDRHRDMQADIGSHRRARQLRDLAHTEPDPPASCLRRRTIMTRIHRIRRLAGVLAGALLALAAAAPAALAVNRPLPDGRPAFVPTYPATSPAAAAVAGGGMPGWQIALIAVGAALVAAIVAVVLDRALAVRKVHATTA